MLRLRKATLAAAALIATLAWGTGCLAGELKVAFTAKKADALVAKFIMACHKALKTIRISALYTEDTDFISLLESKPDLLVGDSSLLSENIALGIFKDITKYVPANVLSDVLPGYMDAYSVGKSLFALPVGGQCATLLYNKKAFKAAGLAAPDGNWTWEAGFVAVARKLAGMGRYGMVGRPQMDFMPLLYGYGGQIADRSLKKVLYTAKPAMTALNLVTRLHKEKLVERVDYSRVDGNNPKTWPFFNGKSAMTGGPGLPMEDREAQEWLRQRKLDMEVGWTYLPKGPKGAKPTTQSLTVGVFNTSKNKKDVTEFLKFLCSKKGQLLLFDTEKYLPATYSAVKDPRVQKAFGARFLKYYEGGRARDLKWEIHQIEGIMWRDVDNIITGQGTMANLVENAATEAANVLAMASYAF